MARILIAVHGSRGDLIPCLRIARALARGGHSVEIAVGEMHADRVKQWGFDPIVAGSYFGVDTVLDISAKMTGVTLGSGQAIRLASSLFAEQVFKPYLLATHNTFSRLIPEFDLVVCRLADVSAGPLCDLHQKPCVKVHYTVLDLPSAYYLPSGVNAEPSAETKRAWEMMLTANQLYMIGALRRTYQELGLRAPRNTLIENYKDSHFHLLTLDPAWAPPAPDWPPSVVQTGFLDPESDELGEASPELKAFLESGSSRPLLVFASGWVPFDDPVIWYQKLIRVARTQGFRVIVFQGFGQALAPAEAGPDVLVLRGGPYDTVLPHASLMVYQGSTATAADCVRYGTPQLVMPHIIYDHLDIALRVEAAGCGTWLWMTECTQERFQKTLAEFAEKLPAFRARAKQLRESVRPGGNERCVTAINDFLTRPARSAATAPES